MPKSLFRERSVTKDPTRHERFDKIIDNLIQRLEDTPRMDIRDYIAAAALIDKVLAREKDDESDRGSAVRKYAPAFKTAHGNSRQSSDTGSAGADLAEDAESDRAADGGESAGSDEADDTAA